MKLLWILFFTWHGTMGFVVHNLKEGLCVEDSSEGDVHLKKCNVNSDLQQWTWMGRFLVNTGTTRCLSAVRNHPVRTVECNSGAHIQWKCKEQQIISVKTSLSLSSERGKLILDEGHHRWTSLDEDDICQEKHRSRRQSETDSEDVEDDKQKPRMTVDQMKFLQWYYRTEDPSSWKFAMLGFSFLGLLMGCALMVMDMMGSRSRKQIAKYRASIKVTDVKPETEELRVIVTEKEKEEKNSSAPLLQNSHSERKHEDEIKHGEIMVTWKDGNVSNLYPKEEKFKEEEDESLEMNDSYQDQNQEIFSPNTPTESEDQRL